MAEGLKLETGGRVERRGRERERESCCQRGQRAVGCGLWAETEGGEQARAKDDDAKSEQRRVIGERASERKNKLEKETYL